MEAISDKVLLILSKHLTLNYKIAHVCDNKNLHN